MKNKFTILGCGSSLGSPWITNNWGNCNKQNKKNLRTRCSANFQFKDISTLIDTSPDIKIQFQNNKIKISHQFLINCIRKKYNELFIYSCNKINHDYEYKCLISKIYENNNMDLFIYLLKNVDNIDFLYTVDRMFRTNKRNTPAPPQDVGCQMVSLILN